MPVAPTLVTFALFCKLIWSRLVSEATSEPPVRNPMFLLDRVPVWSHCVSALVHPLDLTLVESTEPVPPSLPSPPEWRVSCPHPTPLALPREGTPLM